MMVENAKERLKSTARSMAKDVACCGGSGGDGLGNAVLMRFASIRAGGKPPAAGFVFASPRDVAVRFVDRTIVYFHSIDIGELSVIIAQVMDFWQVVSEMQDSISVPWCAHGHSADPVPHRSLKMGVN